MIAPVDGGTFKPLVLEAVGPVAVEFMTYGCTHCRTIEPIYAGVAEHLASKGHFFRVNVAADPGLADRYDVRATPTFVMFLNAKEVGRVEGPKPNSSSLSAALSRPFAW
jgi:thiol-disulfide isomerase/thioredoxin